MRGSRWWQRGALVWLAVVALASAPLAAQVTRLRPEAFRGQPAEQQVQVDITPTLAKHHRFGPSGYITVNYHNPDARAHEVGLKVHAWSECYVLQDQIVLEPQQTVVKHYPLQRYGHDLQVAVTCDRGPRDVGTLGIGSGQVSILLVSQQGRALATFLEHGLGVESMVVEKPSPGVTHTTTVGSLYADAVTNQNPELLPDTWQALAGFDCVAIDGRSTIAEPAQRVLLEYLAAGGALHVFHAEALPSGPLAALGADATRGRHGLGEYCSHRGVPDRAARAWLAGVLGDGTSTGADDRSTTGPARDRLYAPIALPGLGEAPLSAFFVIIALFVLVAGPLNLMFCRRIGRPALVVITLPLLGFGFAAAILVWGLLVEGLGAFGVRQSLTWLDQREHYAVTHSARTIYAGIGPSVLSPAPGTLLTTLAVSDARYASAHRYRFDAARGTIDGSLVPSRTPTHLVAVTPQRLRERLRFRRLSDGSLEVLAAPNFAPLAPGIAVRDHAGQAYLGEVIGDRIVLRRSDAASVTTFVRDARMALVDLATTWHDHDLTAATDAGESRGQQGLTEWLSQQLAELPNGSYLAWTTPHPGVDDFGLVTTWRSERHLVFGLLAGEDFVD